MSGRHEKELNKVSMCEWGIWWESCRLVSSSIQKCVPRRGAFGHSEDRREA